MQKHDTSYRNKFQLNFDFGEIYNWLKALENSAEVLEDFIQKCFV